MELDIAAGSYASRARESMRYMRRAVSKPLSPPAAHALMHLTVFVWGFTAILGKLISISTVPLV